MSKKKNNESERNKNNETKSSDSTNSTQRVLITTPKDDIPCAIASTFDDQFHWFHKINDKKTEVYYSPSVRSVTGYSPEEILEMQAFGLDIIYSEDLPNVKKQLSLFENENRKRLTLVYRIRKKDGKIIWIKEQIKFESNKEGFKILKGLATDISEFRNKEARLSNLTEEQSRQIKARDNFLSVLSHDLRAPFSSILGFTEILLSGAELTEAERAEYLNFIHDSSSNQLQLVNYLLDWSNLKTGRMHVFPQRIQAQSLIYNCISALTGNAIRKNIDIKVNVPDSIFIEADERLMIQVITNLVSNAIKFSEQGKTIQIFTDRFNKEFVEFIVRDEGIGITEKYQNRIFRFDKMFTTKGTKGEKGTGLGLSLVKEIVERHKGQIWFYSKENAGSEFHFTVPSSENSILLVESNKEDYFKFEKIIRENYPDFKLIGTDNGFEAINVVLKQHPSLIISSHDLPLMNGVQFIRSILRGDKKFYAPIIAIVESPNDQLQKSYQEIGIKTILYKPVDPAHFNKVISLALS